MTRSRSMLSIRCPKAPALVPFGAIFATLAVESGWSGWQAMLASATIALASATASVFVWLILGTPWHILLGGIVGLVAAALTARAPAPARDQTTHTTNRGDGDE